MPTSVSKATKGFVAPKVVIIQQQSNQRHWIGHVIHKIFSLIWLPTNQLKVWSAEPLVWCSSVQSLKVEKVKQELLKLQQNIAPKHAPDGMVNLRCQVENWSNLHCLWRQNSSHPSRGWSSGNIKVACQSNLLADVCFLVTFNACHISQL